MNAGADPSPPDRAVIAGLEHAGASRRGAGRAHNEDRWCAHAALGLFAVSDGMGGAPGGEFAAEIVVQSLPGLIAHSFGGGAVRALCADAGPRLRAVLSEISIDVRDRGLARPALAGMGATVVVALVCGGEAVVGHIGDSRAYLWRDGALERLTRDH